MNRKQTKKTKRPVIVKRRTQPKSKPADTLHKAVAAIKKIQSSSKALVPLSREKEKNISKEEFLYGTTYGDPFLNVPASIPAKPTMPHQPLITRGRATFVTNSNGIAWAILRPACTAINDFSCVTYNAPGGSSDVPIFNINNIISADSPYSTSDYNIGSIDFAKKFRIVSIGMRMKYTGTMFNASGRVYTFQTYPGIQGDYNSDGAIGMTPNILQSLGNFKENTFRDSRWHTVTKHVQQPEDFIWQGYNPESQHFQYILNQAANQVSYDDIYTMGILVFAEPNQPVELEFQSHLEITGSSLPTRKLIKTNENFVHKVADAYMQRRFKNKTTPDHSVGKSPSAKGGFLEILKEGARAVLPLIPEILTAFL